MTRCVLGSYSGIEEESAIGQGEAEEAENIGRWKVWRGTGSAKSPDILDGLSVEGGGPRKEACRRSVNERTKDLVLAVVIIAILNTTGSVFMNKE